jgi:hypothetical protein
VNGLRILAGVAIPLHKEREPKSLGQGLGTKNKAASRRLEPFGIRF